MLGKRVANVNGEKIVMAPNTPKEVCDKMKGKYVEFEINGKKVPLCVYKASEKGDSVHYEPLDFELDDTFIRGKLMQILKNEEG